MKRPFPMSLAGRTIFILLVGLTFSHLLSILVFTSEKLESAVLTSEHQVLERMATVIRLLSAMPPALHEPVLAAMNHSGMHFAVLQPDLSDWELPVSGLDELLRQQLAKGIGQGQARVLAVKTGEPDWHHAHGTMHQLLFAMEIGIIRLMHETVMNQELAAWVEFPTGNRVFLTTRPADNHVPLFRHASISVLIMTGAIFLFSLVIAQHMTLPLRRMVRAADDFGRDVYTAPLPEQGATEIIAVARAFNRMNQRIRDFVEDRLRMIAAISHDLRTPLTKLKLMAEFVGDDDLRGRLVATMDEMEAMLTATLTFARDTVTVEPKQKVNLSSLLSSICQDLSDAGMTATFEEMDKQPCHCRPLAMKRALNNLIHNAVKYGGSAQVSLVRAGEKYLVTIRDPGPGIPESAWEDVFKPFFRLDPSRNTDTGGVGLGLSIAVSVIRDHNGAIRFSHPPAGGFITQVELPAGLQPVKPL